MNNIVGIIVKFVLYVIFVLSLWSLLGNYIMRLFRDRSRFKRLMQSYKGQEDKPKSKLFEKLDLALRVIYSSRKKSLKGGYKDRSAYIVILSICLFAFAFTVFIRSSTFVAALFLSLLISLLPFVFIYLKLRAVRIDSSYEGESLVPSLTNYYVESYFNMREAIDRLVCSSSISSFSRNNLFALSTALKSFRNEQELDKAIHDFVFAYNSEWSILLGMNIKIAVFAGTNVRVSLEDIKSELEATRDNVETKKRYNSEAFSIISYLLLPSYLIFILLSNKLFGFTLDKFIEYQFFTPLGLKFFIVMASSIVFCYILRALIKKPKFDI